MCRYYQDYIMDSWIQMHDCMYWEWEWFSFGEREEEIFVQFYFTISSSLDAIIQADLKKNHQALVGQLTSQLNVSLGPQLRRALGHAFVALYTSGETFSLHTTVGKCCDIIRAKEDQSSASNKL